MTSSRFISIPQTGKAGQLGTVPSDASPEVTSSTATFLAMIPKELLDTDRSKSSHPSNKKPTSKEPTPREKIQRRREQSGDVTKLHLATQSAQNTVARVTVRLKSETIEARVRMIVQAAKDHNRLLAGRAELVYEFLVTLVLAHHIALRPDVLVTPNRLMVFLVVDELPALLGLGRATVYRACLDLEKWGLIDRRAWYTDSTVRLRSKAPAQNPRVIDQTSETPKKKKTPRRFAAAAGVVVDVVLTPAQGTQARVPAEALRNRQYRNLDADRQVGRTAWQWMTDYRKAKELIESLEAKARDLSQDQKHIREVKALRTQADAVRQSSFLSGRDAMINHVLRWTLVSSTQTPVSMTVSASAQQEAVYQLNDLRTATPQQRGELINERAQALCLATGDGQHSLNFWCWLLWRMTMLEHMQIDVIQPISAILMRLIVDLREWGSDAKALKPLRIPAALFVSRLKKSGWWDQLKYTEAT